MCILVLWLSSYNESATISTSLRRTHDWTLKWIIPENMEKVLLKFQSPEWTVCYASSFSSPWPGPLSLMGSMNFEVENERILASAPFDPLAEIIIDSLSKSGIPQCSSILPSPEFSRYKKWRKVFKWSKVPHLLSYRRWLFWEKFVRSLYKDTTLTFGKERRQMTLLYWIL